MAIFASNEKLTYTYFIAFFQSLHYTSIIPIQANKCTQLYYSYNDITLTTNPYVSKLRPSLTHHQGALQAV